MHPRIRIGRAFSPGAVALSVPRALPWAGIGARRWRLRPSAGCGFLGSVTTSAFPQTDPLPNFVHPCFRFFRGTEEDDQSFRPFDCAQGFTPAFGRAEAPLRGALFTARLKPCP